MSMRTIYTLLGETIGLDIESLGEESVARAAARLMSAAGISSEAAYVELLRAAPDELTRLIEEIVVPETWFFRDRQPFRVLAQHCRSLCAARGTPARILSAPCATGEEPYSIAIALLAAGVPPHLIRIDALDISARSLEKARAAVYTPHSFRFGCELVQPRFFDATEHGAAVTDEVKRCVSFQRANLLDPCFNAPHPPYDAIFCRNLLIYLTGAARARLIAALCSVLTQEGLLFCGHCEVLIFKNAGFVPLTAAKAFACRKAQASGAAARPAPTRICDDKRDEEKRNCHAFHEALQFSPPSGAEAEAELDADPLLELRELADRGDLDQAGVLAQRLLCERGPDADLFCLMAELSLAARAPQDARQYLQKALYLDPRHYLALLHMRLLCEQDNRPAEAERYRERLNRLGKADAIREQQP